MTDDRQAILDFFATWQEASLQGDLPTLMKLMAEDVVFLRAGQPPMIGADAFAESFQGVKQDMAMNLSDWRVDEIRIEGDWAYARTYLAISVTPKSGGAKSDEETRKMAGHILSIFRKTKNGRWVLFRDANLLAPLF